MIVENILDSYLARPGKLIRTQLIQEIGAQLRLATHDIAMVSQAAEMIHNASLIHDDVVDNAQYRRGQKTLHQLIPRSQAVLAGDYLLAQVIRNLAVSQHHNLLNSLAEALQQIVEGEFLQQELKTKQDVGLIDLQTVAKYKTGALMAWGPAALASLAGKNEHVISGHHELGIRIGLIFQMVDDNLDYSVNSGKDYAKDIQEGLINFTTLAMINLYPELHYPIYQIRGKKLTSFPWSDGQLANAKELVKKQIEEEFNNIIDLLERLDLTQASRLYQIINHLKQRDH